MTTRRKALAIAVLAALAVVPAAKANKYPDRPIKLVVPFPAGGTTDVIARLVASNMSAPLGQEIVVENKGGAATVIGVDAVAKAAPDGYTLLLATATSFSVNPHIYKNLPYSPDEFVPIGFIGEAPTVLVSPATATTKNLPELVKALKSSKNETLIATTGKGGFSHLTAAMFFNAIGARFRDVSYRGEAPALQDLLGGQIGLYFGSMPGTMPYVNMGRLRAYGVTSVDRSPAAPGVPSFTEQGLPDVVAISWFGLAAPRGTPPEVVAALSTALNKAMENPAVLARMASDGAVPRTMRPNDFSDFIRKDNEQWRRIVRAANVEAEGSPR
jgi:tripartite-type tricarboxylate transporter receptor subunit TctC